jgi:GT2 family glycosyltransferase
VHYAPEPIPSSVGDAMHRYIADHETTSITGAFFCCKKKTFDALNGFSTAFPNSFQDVDFCLRARRQGLRCLITPHVKLLHFESVSRDPRVDNETLSTIRAIHGPMIAPFDGYSMYAYETPVVSVFTLTGVRYYLARARNKIVSLVLFIRISVSSGPRHSPSILKNKEWLVR